MHQRFSLRSSDKLRRPYLFIHQIQAPLLTQPKAKLAWPAARAHGKLPWCRAISGRTTGMLRARALQLRGQQSRILLCVCFLARLPDRENRQTSRERAQNQQFERLLLRIRHAVVAFVCQGDLPI